MTTSISTTGQTRRPTLLVVDDTPENLSVLGEILMSDYQVRVANSGARALQAVVTEPRPDLVLLDVMMPGMDGYEVLRRFREDPVTRTIPVIFVTALNATEDETHGLELGAVDYITKPVRPAVVLARVRTHLELKQAKDRLQDQNNWLEEEIKRRMHDNEVIQDVSMRALASLAEIRDNETGLHIIRTQNYVRILADDLARQEKYKQLLQPHVIDIYYKAAPLHDIGKVGIPDAVLHKPGSHTPEERNIMQTHAKLGADAIWHAIMDQEEARAVDYLYVAMDIAHYHHEKWDGTGYPEGRVGDAIPLAARLMALADVFDALISRRVYKAPMPPEEAMRIILDGRGKHFDPDIVDAFIRCKEEFFRVAGNYADSERV